MQTITTTLFGLAVALTACKSGAENLPSSAPKAVEVKSLAVSTSLPGKVKLDEYDDMGAKTARLRNKDLGYQVTISEAGDSALPFDMLVESREKPALGSFGKWIKKEQTADGYYLEWEDTPYDDTRFNVDRLATVGGKKISCRADTTNTDLVQAMRDACQLEAVAK